MFRLIVTAERLAEVTLCATSVSTCPRNNSSTIQFADKGSAVYSEVTAMELALFTYNLRWIHNGLFMIWSMISAIQFVDWRLQRRDEEATFLTFDARSSRCLLPFAY